MNFAGQIFHLKLSCRFTAPAAYAAPARSCPDRLPGKESGLHSKYYRPLRQYRARPFVHLDVTISKSNAGGAVMLVGGSSVKRVVG